MIFFMTSSLTKKEGVIIRTFLTLTKRQHGQSGDDFAEKKELMAGLFEIRTWPANVICHRFQLIDRKKQKSEVGGASSNSFVHTEKGDLNFLPAEKDSLLSVQSSVQVPDEICYNVTDYKG